MRIFPRHEFQALANKYHVGQKFRLFSRWTLFVSLLTAQLTRCYSLRDVVENMSAQTDKLYHLGIKRNAVMTQLWIALCACLVLVFLKFQSKLGHSMQS